MCWRCVYLPVVTTVYKTGAYVISTDLNVNQFQNPSEKSVDFIFGISTTGIVVEKQVFCFPGYFYATRVYRKPGTGLRYK